MKLKPGDGVMVKQGVKEPGFEKFELSGWQGRVTEIDPFSNGYGPVKFGDKVSIKALPHAEEMYGIIAEIMLGRRKYGFPLCDLKVTDKSSPNYQLIGDYRVWFANR